MTGRRLAERQQPVESMKLVLSWISHFVVRCFANDTPH
jgi:hypothetical protein